MYFKAAVEAVELIPRALKAAQDACETWGIKLELLLRCFGTANSYQFFENLQSLAPKISLEVALPLLWDARKARQDGNGPNGTAQDKDWAPSDVKVAAESANVELVSESKRRRRTRDAANGSKRAKTIQVGSPGGQGPSAGGNEGHAEWAATSAEPESANGRLDAYGVSEESSSPVVGRRPPPLH